MPGRFRRLGGGALNGLLPTLPTGFSEAAFGFGAGLLACDGFLAGEPRLFFARVPSHSSSSSPSSSSENLCPSEACAQENDSIKSDREMGD